MSYCELYVVRKTGRVELFGQARNGRCYALEVWRYLRDKYGIQGDDGESTSNWVHKVWQLRAEQLTDHEWLLLRSTGDNAIVPEPLVDQLEQALRWFVFVLADAQRETCTVDGIWSLIGAVQGSPDLKGYRGVAFRASTVCENAWRFYNSKTDRYNSLNVDRHRLTNLGGPIYYVCSREEALRHVPGS